MRHEAFHRENRRTGARNAEESVDSHEVTKNTKENQEQEAEGRVAEARRRIGSLRESDEKCCSPVGVASSDELRQRAVVLVAAMAERDTRCKPQEARTKELLTNKRNSGQYEITRFAWTSSPTSQPRRAGPAARKQFHGERISTLATQSL